jgi:hypothetical protein
MVSAAVGAAPELRSRANGVTLTHLGTPGRNTFAAVAQSIHAEALRHDADVEAVAARRRADAAGNERITRAGVAKLNKDMRAVLASPMLAADFSNELVRDHPPRMRPDPYRDSHQHFLRGARYADLVKDTADALAAQFRRVEGKFSTANRARRRANR